MKLSIIDTKTAPTVRIEFDGKIITFHSKYDPIHASKKWVENALTLLKTNEEIIIIGLCAGYHIQAIAQVSPNVPITVIEFNDSYFDWFIESAFFNNIIEYPNVSLKQFSKLDETYKKELFSSISSSNILVSNQYLEIVPKKLNAIVAILENINLQNNSLTHQRGYMQENFKQNIALNDEGIHSLKDKYKEKPMILIAAGPSLNKQLPLLKKIKSEGKFVLGAVGTALSPLIAHGIIPDFYAIIDAQATQRQLHNIELPNSTLFYLSTTSTNTILQHTGPRRIIWQKGYPDAEKLAAQQLDPIIETGGSVATTLLDIMVYLGGKSIALVGQDLAFTDGKTHAEGTHSSKQVEDKNSVHRVMNYYRTGTVTSSKNLNLYRTWFESYVQNHPEVAFFNCTEGGAHIKNFKHISLLDYFHQY